MPNLQVVHGKVVKQDKLAKHAVTIVCNSGTRALQLIAAQMMVGIKGLNADGSKLYAGPTLTLFQSLRQHYVVEMAGLDYVGTLLADQETGKIDWVESTDGQSIIDVNARAEAFDTASKEHGVHILKVPKNIDRDSAFVAAMMADPILQSDLANAEDGRDMIPAILRSVKRMSEGER